MSPLKRIIIDLYFFKWKLGHLWSSKSRETSWDLKGSQKSMVLWKAGRNVIQYSQTTSSNFADSHSWVIQPQQKKRSSGTSFGKCVSGSFLSHTWFSGFCFCWLKTGIYGDPLETWMVLVQWVERCIWQPAGYLQETCQHYIHKVYLRWITRYNDVDIMM